MSSKEFPSQLLSREDKIRRLVESGEVFDERDAEDALQEEEDAEFLRTINRGEYLAKIDAVLNNPETAPDVRWDANFQKAVVATAETPDELEFLAYHMLRDLPFGKPADDMERRRQESTKRRLEKKINDLGAKIGAGLRAGREAELFSKYRRALQELFGTQTND